MGALVSNNSPAWLKALGNFFLPNNPSQQTDGIQSSSGPTQEAGTTKVDSALKKSRFIETDEIQLPIDREKINKTYEAWTERCLGEYASREGQFGKLLYAHIERQLEKLKEPVYANWFTAARRQSGLEPALIAAAIATSDLTKFDSARTKRGVDDAQALNVPLYGANFEHYEFFETLFMHAQAAVMEAQIQFSGFAAECGLNHSEIALATKELSDAIVGHDSFTQGFGMYVLLTELEKKYPDKDIAPYPSSVSSAGFVVQLMDRLDALNAGTVLRYVLESLARIKQSLEESSIKDSLDDEPIISQAIRLGVQSNITDSRLHHRVIGLQTRRTLEPQVGEDFASFPAFKEFEGQINRAEQLFRSFLLIDGYYQVTDNVGNKFIIKSEADLARLFRVLSEGLEIPVR